MITRDSTIPQVLDRHPEARSVFDRYGLHGCGGVRGPDETLEFFARVHGIDLDRLISELEHAPRDSNPDAGYSESLADGLYRRFFRGAMVALLTAGATLGAALLFFIALAGSFTSLDVFPFIQAHANAQVFGWIGLFVMGFAMQGLPRFKYVRLWRPELGAAAFSLMLAGLFLRTIGAMLPASAAWVPVSGGVFQALSVALFVVVLWKTLATRTLREAWDRYVLTASVLFLVAAILEPVMTALMHGADPDILVRRIINFSGPFRDIQVLGFAGLMTLGVSQKVLPAAFGFRSCGPGTSAFAFALLTGGLVLDVAGWLAFRAWGSPAFAVASWGGMAAYAIGALVLAVSMRGLTAGGSERSAKFIRAAFLWLVVACVLVLVQPAYSMATGLRFSHAYAGAARHAFTVGFLSMMIVGISSKVVPILVGAPPGPRSALWGPFILIAGGNAIRVIAQILTDAAPDAAYPLLGISGTFEVIGFALWSVSMFKLLGYRAAAGPRGARPGRVDKSMTPAAVIGWFPETLEVFESFGFGTLRNPMLRRTLGASITLETACTMKKVDLDSLLAALNRPRAG